MFKHKQETILNKTLDKILEIKQKTQDKINLHTQDWEISYKLTYTAGKVKNWFKKHMFYGLVIILILAVCSYFVFGAVRQSIGNLEQNKSSLIDKIKSILGKNDQDQLDTLNEIEAKLVENLLPLVDTPVVGWVVKNDIAKIKELIAIWLDALYPFANYKFGVDGFRTVLLQQRYFTQDVESFLGKAPELISKTKSQMNWLWVYQTFGTQQIKEVFGYLNMAMEILEILIQKKDIVLTGLGHYQTQKIVIFNQNTGEARPTGGFIGSYIPINISKGEMTIGQSQSIYWFDKGVGTNLLSHPAMWYYGFFGGLVDPHGARNSNVFSCFPDSARYLEREFSKTENGYNIDSVVFITPQYLLGYLPDSFNLAINGELIPKNKILDKIEQITALEIEDKLNPKKQLTSIFNLIIKQLPTILKGQALVDLLVYTQESLLSRDMQVWFRSNKIQELWSSTGFAGEQTCQNKTDNKTDFGVISPIIINMSGDKRNLVSSNNFIINTDTDKNTLTLTWTQILPKDIKQTLRRATNEDGLTMVGVQMPKGAKIISSTSPNILHLPFLRDYYQLQLEKENPNNSGTYTIPPEIQSLIVSSYDLSADGDAGFSYLQPDGSEVFGVYLKDNISSQSLSVEFKFDISSINSATSSNLVFYGQSGLNKPSLSSGSGYYDNPKQIQKGIKIQ